MTAEPADADGAGLRVLPFGGCLTNWPLRSEHGPGVAAKYSAVPIIHTFGEMFQVVDILRGKKKVPRELRPLCRTSAALRALSDGGDFCDVDVAVVEPASPTELLFRGYSLNRGGVLNHIIRPIQKYGKDAAKAATRWFRVGLSGRNDQVRAETAEIVLRYLTDGSPETELQRAVILETETSENDIAGGFRKMQELLPCPMAVVVYVFSYMPDGRPVGWNAEFREQILATAKELDLPCFDPAPLVAKFGVANAMLENSGHYSEAFTPVIARALGDFARDVWRQGRASAKRDLQVA